MNVKIKKKKSHDQVRFRQSLNHYISKSEIPGYDKKLFKNSLPEFKEE
jgi:hypothetical protein